MKTDSSVENPLTFAWWGKRPAWVVLPGFLILSLLAHAGTFIFFQITYPEKVTIPRTAPRVSLLTPSSPENVSLLRWIDSEDPALVTTSPRGEPTGLAELEYKPFFSISHTPARYVAPPQEKTPFPAGRDLQEMIESVSPRPRTPAAAPAPVRTRAILSGEISRRTFTKHPEFTPCSASPLEAARFLIGVTNRGELRYVFLQHGSGDPNADASAAERLAEASIEPSKTAITWGFATVEWGDDAYFTTRSRPPAGNPQAPSREIK